MQGCFPSLVNMGVIAGICTFPAASLEAQSPAASSRGIDDYDPGPDSDLQPGVPEGKQFSFTLADSKIFPGTSRKITVYVPAQYSAERPACVYVALDGLGFGAPVVFDNLIHKGEMPVTIAVGVSPGAVLPARASRLGRRTRSCD